MTIEQILKAEKVGDIFTISGIKDQYRILSKQFHPDICKDPRSSDVFDKIQKFYKKAIKMIESGEWERSNWIRLKEDNGKRVEITYKKVSNFELGNCYVTNTKVIYILDSAKEKYYNNAISTINKFKFKSKDIKQMMSPYLPEIFQTFKLEDGRLVIVFQKNADIYPLRNLLEYYNGKISDKHVAWMITRMMNFLCYMQTIGYTHNGLTIDNLYVCPEFHSIVFIGGWWYSTPIDSKMIGTCKEVYDIMPINEKTSKKSTQKTDIESVKNIARTLLGKDFVHLDYSKMSPFDNFLISGSSNDPVLEFKKWEDTLINNFGERRFIKMEVDKNKIY